MLKFSRSKLASVYRKDDQTLSVHGILQDDVYGLEVNLDIDLSSLEILSVRGQWNRMENSHCPRAIPFLQEAVGFRMDGDFVRKVQKVVGRKACRQFADLILECCDAAKDAASLIQEEESKTGPGMEINGLFGKVVDHQKVGSSVAGKSDEPGQELPGGILIDLHVHSFPASPCSSISVSELVEEAQGIGLDGICLTDHNHLRSPREVEELRQKHGFLILGGNEITTDQGDILVFGMEEDIKGVILLAELRKKVLRAGGFMIVAHPFRGFLTFGVGYLGLTAEKAMARPVFKLVDAVEVLNSKVSAQENSFAAEVAGGLGLPVTGGSDAHAAGDVGLFATRFSCPVVSERDLIEAMQSGKAAPVTFRKRNNGAHA
ncbi:MAG TPA: CehA/McbA family metallohydrolase [Spirochaetia bacterium]|nr:CehA/McbA family metallohydrolase [Spirochaetia bacterium]